ncbi:unnamed protein product [Didymodactylos carnosus]|uniref:Uncharacterized protein n=1 Tax=Didymodactylos carnosus TaxID=1234261 RepID=A0A814W9C2_9BILA|nr:unnamed protein product [Didymodactylos carnosus]CAF3966513.1 unnamed protein product [Didymodactylos carnosus]
MLNSRKSSQRHRTIVRQVSQDDSESGLSSSSVYQSCRPTRKQRKQEQFYLMRGADEKEPFLEVVEKSSFGSAVKDGKLRVGGNYSFHDEQGIKRGDLLVAGTLIQCAAERDKLNLLARFASEPSIANLYDVQPCQVAVDFQEEYTRTKIQLKLSPVLQSKQFESSFVKHSQVLRKDASANGPSVTGAGKTLLSLQELLQQDAEQQMALQECRAELEQLKQTATTSHNVMGVKQQSMPSSQKENFSGDYSENVIITDNDETLRPRIQSPVFVTPKPSRSRIQSASTGRHGSSKQSTSTRLTTSQELLLSNLSNETKYRRLEKELHSLREKYEQLLKDHIHLQETSVPRPTAETLHYFAQVITCCEPKPELQAERARAEEKHLKIIGITGDQLKSLQGTEWSKTAKHMFWKLFSYEDCITMSNQSISDEIRNAIFEIVQQYHPRDVIQLSGTNEALNACYRYVQSQERKRSAAAVDSYIYFECLTMSSNVSASTERRHRRRLAQGLPNDFRVRYCTQQLGVNERTRRRHHRRREQGLAVDFRSHRQTIVLYGSHKSTRKTDDNDVVRDASNADEWMDICHNNEELSNFEQKYNRNIQEDKDDDRPLTEMEIAVGMVYFKTKFNVSRAAIQYVLWLLKRCQVQNVPSSYQAIVYKLRTAEKKKRQEQQESNSTFDELITTTTSCTFCPQCGNISRSINHCQDENCQQSIAYDEQQPIGFLEFDIKHQIMQILPRQEVQFTTHLNDDVPVSDIINSPCYKRISNNERGRFITLTMNVDGIAIDTAGETSIWVIMFIINEIKRQQRYLMSSCIIGGIYPGARKPNRKQMSEMLRCMYEQLELLEQNITYTLKHGATVRTNKTKTNRIRVFIPGQQQAPLRTNERYDMAIQYIESTDPSSLNTINKKTIFARKLRGYLSYCHLRQLQYFKIGLSCVFDSLHTLYQGCFKRLLSLYFDKKNRAEDYSCYEHTQLLAERLKQVKFPSTTYRIPRALDKWRKFKANELRTMLLFGFVIFEHLLVAPYYEHLLLLVGIAHLAEARRTYKEYPAQIKLMAEKFIIQFPKLYTARHHVQNVHQISHTSLSVADNGLLSCYSTFSFESLLGIITSSVMGTKNFGQEIRNTLELLQIAQMLLYENDFDRRLKKLLFTLFTSQRLSIKGQEDDATSTKLKKPTTVNNQREQNNVQRFASTNIKYFSTIFQNIFVLLLKTANNDSDCVNLIDDVDQLLIRPSLYHPTFEYIVLIVLEEDDIIYLRKTGHSYSSYNKLSGQSEILPALTT